MQENFKARNVFRQKIDLVENLKGRKFIRPKILKADGKTGSKFKSNSLGRTLNLQKNKCRKLYRQKVKQAENFKARN